MSDLHPGAEAKPGEALLPSAGEILIPAPATGYLHGFDGAVMAVGRGPAPPVRVRLLHPIGTHLLQGVPVAAVSSDGDTGLARQVQTITAHLLVEDNPPQDHFSTGFSNLTEVAVKALSPGINDPATAVLSLQALCGLLYVFIRQELYKPAAYHYGHITVSPVPFSVADITDRFLHPIWDYGKKDRMVQAAIQNALTQLTQAVGNTHPTSALSRLLNEVNTATLE
jgi:uncharacterized membrane protein